MWLRPLVVELGQSLWLAPNCSLMPALFNAAKEQRLPHGLTEKLAFAVQKPKELVTLRDALSHPLPVSD